MFVTASKANFEGPKGFSFEASLIILDKPNSRLTSDIGLPAL